MATMPSGLRLDAGIISFDFQPSIGILARDIDTLGEDISNFKAPLNWAIREVMAPSFEKNFASQGRPSWVPMSQSTQAIRARAGQSGPLLNRSGSLKAAVTSPSLWTVTDTFAAVKSLPANVSYGNIHQEGYGGMGKVIKANMKRGMSASAAAKKAMADLDKKILAGGARRGGSAAAIPARPFVLYQDEDAENIERIFSEWLAQKIELFALRGGGA